MPVIVRLVHRIISDIGVAVGADAVLGRIPVIGAYEAAKQRIHIAGVEVDQPGRRANDSLDRLPFRLTGIVALARCPAGNCAANAERGYMISASGSRC